MSNFFLGFAEIVWFDTKFWKSTIVRVLWYPHQRTSDGETSPKRWELQEAPCGSCSSCRLEDGLWGDSTAQVQARHIYIYTFAAGVVTQVISVI
jgi:hypothetical protein